MVKIKTSYNADQTGIAAARRKQETDGGWIAHQYRQHFNHDWLDGVYHYSIGYLPRDIMADLPGNVTLNPKP